MQKYILRHMIHSLCRDSSQRKPCFGDDGNFPKSFPKEFRDETNVNVNGYSKYQ